MMISTLFYPLVTFVLAVIVTSFWGATALFLASSGDPVYRVDDLNRTIREARNESLHDTNCNVTVSLLIDLNIIIKRNNSEQWQLAKGKCTR